MTTDQTIIIDTPQGIALYQFLVRKTMLKIEIRTGMKRRGRSAYSIIKSEYGLKGSRASVLAQMEAMTNG